MISSTATSPQRGAKPQGKRRQEANHAIRAHLSSTARQDHEPAVGASTCASGNQVCKGRAAP